MQKRWIWQYKEYPNFPFDRRKIEDKLKKINYLKGLMVGIISMAGDKELDEIEIATVTDEIVATSEIEGEYLKRESVRDSVAKMINKELISDIDSSTRHTDNLAKLVLDSCRNREPLTLQRIHGWHNALFEGSDTYSGIDRVKSGVFRDYDDMKVVENRFGRSGGITKYVAPPHTMIETNINNLIEYCNNYDEDPHIKSAVAHLWFVSIHPYDDGNGRISRAIADYMLYSDYPYALFSLSSAIRGKHSEYYEILDETTNLHKNRHYDFTLWIDWNLKMMIESLERTKKRVEFIVKKSKFWDRCRYAKIGDTQREFLSVMLDRGLRGESMHFTNRDYRLITKAGQVTASRQIKRLLQERCISQIKGKGGRSIEYKINI